MVARPLVLSSSGARSYSSPPCLPLNTEIRSNRCSALALTGRHPPLAWVLSVTVMLSGHATVCERPLTAVAAAARTRKHALARLLPVAVAPVFGNKLPSAVLWFGRFQCGAAEVASAGWETCSRDWIGRANRSTGPSGIARL